MTTRSGLKDERGHLWEAKIQQPVWPLVGGEVRFYDHLPADRPGKVSFGGEEYTWHLWGNVVKPAPGSETWGTYEDQFYKGDSAILHRDFGKGSSTYVGVWTEDWELEYDVLRRIYGKVAGDLPFDLEPYVFVDYREGLWVAVNYTDKKAAIPVPDGAEILLGEADLPPAGVLVWRAP